MQGFRKRIVRAIAALAIAGGVVGALAPAATAATTIGSTALTPGPFECDSPSTYFSQSTDAASPSYAVPAGGGVITSWSVPAGAGPAEVKLGLLRPNLGPSTFTTADASAAESLAPSSLNTFDTRIPAQAGDRIAALIVSGSYPCASQTGDIDDIAQRDSLAVHDTGSIFTYDDPNPSTVILIAATVEPDADGDRFGDETQDLCLTDPTKQAECVAPETTITKQPANKTTKKKAKYKFTSNEPGSSFECQIDDKPYAACSSPRKFRAPQGKHKFNVRAIDPAGNFDLTPAKDKFKRLP